MVVAKLPAVNNRVTLTHRDTYARQSCGHTYKAVVSSTSVKSPMHLVWSCCSSQSSFAALPTRSLTWGQQQIAYLPGHKPHWTMISMGVIYDMQIIYRH